MDGESGVDLVDGGDQGVILRSVALVVGGVAKGDEVEALGQSGPGHGQARERRRDQHQFA